MLSRFPFFVHCLYGLCWCVCVVFSGLIVVGVFVESYCFVRLVVWLSILFVSYEELVEESAI